MTQLRRLSERRAELEGLAVQFDDDDAIDVDEALDQLTELLFVPSDSPASQVRRAIPLRPQRRALVILPEELASSDVRAPAPVSMPRLAGARTMQLTPFAARSLRHRG